MKIRKAVITAAGRNQRTLPLQTLVDRDGQSKTALAIMVEEVLQAGIEEICVVVCPGDQAAYRRRRRPARQSRSIRRADPRRWATATPWPVRAQFTGDEPFLLLVGDHLYVSRNEKRCAQQLVEIAAAEACAVSAVQATHESKLPYYGAVGGRLAAGPQRACIRWIRRAGKTHAHRGRAEADRARAARRPLPLFLRHARADARRHGHCCSSRWPRPAKPAACISPTPWPRLAERERYLACELQGRRYDIGVQYGLLTAQLALALDGKDRDEVLTGWSNCWRMSGK